VATCGRKLKEEHRLAKESNKYSKQHEGKKEKTYAEVDLEGVIDQPLEGGQCANHANAHRQTVPKTAEANVAVNPADGRASTFTGLAVGVEL
jgi:hypothetical protein